VRTICVFCGSNPGTRPEYLSVVGELGRGLAGRGLRVVYGGAAVGAMGALADAATAAGGEVIGVIPRALVDAEIAHAGLTDLRVAGSMHERKATMAELAVDERFLRPEHRTLLMRERAVEPLLDAMAAWTPTTVAKWL
jgi:uncharacterized protein (TIGR00730 family)